MNPAPTRWDEQARGTSRSDAPAAVALVAATYVYFLLFAQFGFLQGLRGMDEGVGRIQILLGAMTAAGVAASFAAPRVIGGFGPGGAMALGFTVSAAAAASAGFAFTSGFRDVGHLMIAAIGIGVGLGLTTVALATDFRRLTRGRHSGRCAGIGTGLAYFMCDLPAIYDAAPTTKAWIVAASAIAAIGVVVVSRGTGDSDVGNSGHDALVPPGWHGIRGLGWVVAAFMALVWFDSTAFEALQLDPVLHDRQWGTALSHWMNGSVHFVAGVTGGVLLDRGHLRGVLMAALAALVAGAGTFAAAGIAGAMAMPVYVAGVSLYSTALAVFAALTPAGDGCDAPAWRAAWIYAIAGWIGSATGVGLAEQMGRLPAWSPFLAAGILAFALARSRAMRFSRPLAKETAR